MRKLKQGRYYNDVNSRGRILTPTNVYQHYCKITENPMSKSAAVKIFNSFFEKMGTRMIENGDVFRLRTRFDNTCGQIVIKHTVRHPKSKAINFRETLRQGFTVYHVDPNFAFFDYELYGTKSIAVYNGVRKYWKFTPVKTKGKIFKRLIAHIRENGMDAYKKYKPKKRSGRRIEVLNEFGIVVNHYKNYKQMFNMTGMSDSIYRHIVLYRNGKWKGLTYKEVNTYIK